MTNIVSTDTELRESTATQTPCSAFLAWLDKDGNQLAWWLTSPIGQARWHLGRSVSHLGGAISRLGVRIDDDAPGDFWDGYREGQQMIALLAGAVPHTTREDVSSLFDLVGLPSDDETIAKMGRRWPEAGALQLVRTPCPSEAALFKPSA